MLSNMPSINTTTIIDRFSWKKINQNDLHIYRKLFLETFEESVHVQNIKQKLFHEKSEGETYLQTKFQSRDEMREYMPTQTLPNLWVDEKTLSFHVFSINAQYVQNSLEK